MLDWLTSNSTWLQALAAAVTIAFGAGGIVRFLRRRRSVTSETSEATGLIISSAERKARSLRVWALIQVIGTRTLQTAAALFAIAVVISPAVTFLCIPLLGIGGFLFLLGKFAVAWIGPK